MLFPKNKINETKKFVIKSFDGGANVSSSPDKIKDNQVKNINNMWWQDDMLSSRPGFRITALDVEEGMHVETFGANISLGEGKNKYKKIVRLFEKKGEDNYMFANSYRKDFSDIELKNTVFEFSHPFDAESVCIIGNRGTLSKTVDENASLAFVGPSSVSTAVKVLSQKGFEDWKDASEEVYIPLIFKDGKGVETWREPQVIGNEYEDFNMLSSKFKARFTAHGNEKNYYFLPVKDIDNKDITINYRVSSGVILEYLIPQGKTVSEVVDGIAFRIHRKGGYIYPVANGGASVYNLPSAGIDNNIEVIASKHNEEDAIIICGMRQNVWFGGDRSEEHSGARLFLSGNKMYPGRVHWSGANNDLYFPRSNFTYLGEAGKEVTAFAKQGGRLVLFKADEIYTINYSGQSRSGNRVQFPVTQISAYVGCDCPSTIQICNGQLVWLSSIGKIYTLNSVGSGAKVLELSRNISSWFDDKIYLEYKSSLSVVWKGHYLLYIGREVFLINFGNKKHEAYARGLFSGSQDDVAFSKWNFDFGFVVDIFVADEDRLLVSGSFYISRNKTVIISGYLDNKIDDVLIESAENISGYEIEKRDIVSFFATKEFDLGYRNQLKDISKCYVDLKIPEDFKGEFNLVYIADGDYHVAKAMTPVNEYDMTKFDLFLSRVSKISFIFSCGESNISFKIGECNFFYKTYKGAIF